MHVQPMHRRTGTAGDQSTSILSAYARLRLADADELK